MAAVVVVVMRRGFGNNIKLRLHVSLPLQQVGGAKFERLSHRINMGWKISVLPLKTGFSIETHCPGMGWKNRQKFDASCLNEMLHNRISPDR